MLRQRQVQGRLEGQLLDRGTDAEIEAVMAQRFGGGTFSDMHPDIAYMGNLVEKTTKNIPDDQGEMGPDETWLPDQTFAAVWKQFLEGQLVPPPPPPPQ